MEKRKIRAVHDDDLGKLLKDLNIYQDVLEGKKKCKFCEVKITLDNLQALYPDSGNISLICDKVECLKSFNMYIYRKGV